MLKLAALGAIACAMVCGCVSATRYPEQWPSSTSGGPDCKAISGVYSNSGTSAESDSLFGLSAGSLRPASLSSLFHNTLANPAVTDPHLSADRVRIDAGTPGFLKVAMVYEAREELLIFEEAKGQFSCSAGKLHIRWSKVEAAVRVLGVGGDGRENTFTRGHDGSLIVEQQTWAAGLAMVIIPIAASSKQWYRFENATAAPADVPSM